MTVEQKLERLLDRIADELILSEYVSTADVKKNQKFIRNGQIQFGDLDDGNNLALYQKDREANSEDLGDELRVIANTIVDFDTLVVSVSGGVNNTITVSLMGGGLPDTGQEISNLIFQQTEDGVIINPLNVTQFIPLQQSGSVVDLNTANEFLDTNIYELLPTGDTRQARIIRFFQELNALLPPETPEFNTPVTRDEEGNWVGSEAYSSDNSISYAQDNPSLSSIDEENAFIHRIKGGSVPANSTNSTRTIEDIYNTIEPYLKDILEDPPTPQDERPEYRNQSSGYLQFRNPNQGIIIRNTNSPFVENLNADTRDYLNTGFTITMWVRFLDKTSEGTLFNFGNPTRRDTSAFGFKLETYVIKGNDKPRKIAEAGQLEGEYIEGFGTSAQYQGTWRQIFENGSFEGNTFEGQQNTSMYRGYRRLPQENFFRDTDTERFVRLVVREGGPDFRLRGSHTGMPFMARRMGLPEMGYQDQYSDNYSNGGMADEKDPSGIVQYDHTYGLMTNTLIPFDPTEWYFICATYNPNIEEDLSHLQTNMAQQPVINNLSFDKSYWHNHRTIENTNPDDNPDMEAQYAANFTTLSNEGNRCKVEIISRSDLLRARGFKV